MLGTLRTVASLLVGTALLLVGVGLLTTLIPLRGVRFGYSKALVGGLTSAYYAGYLIGSFVMPRLVRRIGHIRAFAFCTTGAACIVLLHTFNANPVTWVVLRLLAGIVLVSLYAVIESWLNVQAPPGKRGVVFAIYMVVNLGSLALGQQLLRIHGQAFLLFAVVALLVCAASLPVLATRQAQPQPQVGPQLQLRLLFRVTPTAGLGALLTGLALSALYGLLPVYARENGFSTTVIGTYMTIAIAGGAALQWPLGKLSDRYDRRIVLALVATAAVALALANFVFGRHEIPAMVVIFLYGGMSFAVYPILVAHVVDHARPEDLLATSSSVYLVYGVGAALGPVIVGALMGVVGARALFAWFAAIHAVLAAYAIWRYLAFKRPPTDTPVFRPMLRTTPAALRLLRAAVHARRAERMRDRRG